MANKMKFDSYGGVVDHFDHKEGKVNAFNEKSGGPVDPYGDNLAKDKDDINMNAAEAFNKKDYQKVEAMGTDYPKKSGKPGQFSDNKGDHFKTETDNADIAPMGDDCGKSQSYQTSKRK